MDGHAVFAAAIKPFKFRLKSLDTGPDDFITSLPLEGIVKRQIPGSDNPNYHIVQLEKMVKLGTTKGVLDITHLIITPYILGDKIQRGEKDLSVNIAYVVDQTLLQDQLLDFDKLDHVAIGFCELT